ncbi:MAG TPA: AI-2E family transporter [Chloroflexota bacterium]
MVVRWAALLAAVAVLVLARRVLAPFIVAAVLAYVFSPLVDTLVERTRLRRGLVVGVLYVAAVAVVVVTVRLIGPPLTAEVRALTAASPSIAGAAVQALTGGRTLEVLGQRVEPGQLAAYVDGALADYFGDPTEALHVVEQVFHMALDSILVLILTFYFLLDGGRIGGYLGRFVPVEHRDHAQEVARRVHVMLGRYLRGQLYLVILMSVVTYVLLRLLFGLPYAIAIAIATGLLEIIPLLGPLIAGGIATTVALAHGGPGQAIGVAITYTVLRQLEDQVAMPVVVGRAVHLHPVATLFAVLAGGAIAGVLGMLLAVPAAAAIKVLLDDLYPAPPRSPLATVAPEPAVARPAAPAAPPPDAPGR